MKRWFIALLMLLILLFGVFFVMRNVDLLRMRPVAWDRCVAYTIEEGMTVEVDEMVMVSGIPARVLIAHSEDAYVAGIFEGDGTGCLPLAVRSGEFIDTDDTRPLWTSYDVFGTGTDDALLLRLYPSQHSIVVYAEDGELQSAKFIEEFEIFNQVSTLLRNNETFGPAFYFGGPDFTEHALVICLETDRVCLDGDERAIRRGVFTFRSLLTPEGTWTLEDITRQK